ncbi:MAG: 3D domain-containing protein [Bdellovibrionota bacterium]
MSKSVLGMGMASWLLMLLMSVIIFSACAQTDTTDRTNANDSNLIAEEDMRKIPDLLPTTYYLAYETRTSCKGMYRGVDYKGDELSEVLTPANEVLAQVCTRFLQVLKMEGSGVLKDRGQGPVTINWAGNGRFRVLDRCTYGEGTKDYCLLPFYTIAADLKVHKPGEILYVPTAKGLKLPDGTTHLGFFEVRDTGSAFVGIGAQRVDLFVAEQDDSDNVFREAGMNHKTPLPAFKVTGESAMRAQVLLKEKFKNLY